MLTGKEQLVTILSSEDLVSSRSSEAVDSTLQVTRALAHSTSIRLEQPLTEFSAHTKEATYQNRGIIVKPEVRCHAGGLECQLALHIVEPRYQTKMKN